MAYRNNARLDVEVLRFQGDLNAAEMIRMKDRLSRLMNKNHKRMVLDLSSAHHADLVGLGILVDRLIKVRACHGVIKLCNIRPEVAKTFDRVGVRNLMQSYNTEAEALQSFASA
ncbi:MAG: STAS domain-containing protein [Candidatus Omnitrophica bacterium]|nr:STAS domain-containing protein [Candidatus Omnitrophota bacterium]